MIEPIKPLNDAQTDWTFRRGREIGLAIIKLYSLFSFDSNRSLMSDKSELLIKFGNYAQSHKKRKRKTMHPTIVLHFLFPNNDRCQVIYPAARYPPLLLSNLAV